MCSSSISIASRTPRVRWSMTPSSHSREKTRSWKSSDNRWLTRQPSETSWRIYVPRKPKPEVVPPGTTDVGPKVMADEQSAPPALFQHALKTYEAMLIKAKEVSTTEGVLVVYEGKLTDLITKELYLSTPYYTSITRVLKAMG